MSHTPGPWRVVGDETEGFIIVVGEGASTVIIADIWRSMEDAKLAAAAPQMLEALQEVDRTPLAMNARVRISMAIKAAIGE